MLVTHQVYVSVEATCYLLKVVDRCGNRGAPTTPVVTPYVSLNRQAISIFTLIEYDTHEGRVSKELSP